VVDTLSGCAVEVIAIKGATENKAKAAPKIRVGDWYRENMAVTPWGD
jgi:hypothetical protein